MRSRRGFLKSAALAGLAVGPGGALARLAAQTATNTTLPFDNGSRPLVQYPQKRPLIRLTTRPPQLETPFSVFNESAVTPNDAFFVRYHLSELPLEIDPTQFNLEIKGRVNRAISIPLSELKTQFERVEMVAVCQCSGNSRGFFEPRVGGGQMGHGAMGNALWTGVRLKHVLEKAGVAAGARQVIFNGLDRPAVATIPDYTKALDIDHALDGEVMLAYGMNGEDMPMLNGFPLRLIVPGYYGTYWIKHLNEISVLDENHKGYWMNPAYRIPDNDGACVPPGTTPTRTVPINRMNVRSFITNFADGAQIRSGEAIPVKGIAFDGGHGIRQVVLSVDGGKTWRESELSKDLGKYSFRQWTGSVTFDKPGKYTLKVKATNLIGQSQPLEPLWNPAGYMRNVVETVNVTAV